VLKVSLILARARYKRDTPLRIVYARLACAISGCAREGEDAEIGMA